MSNHKEHNHLELQDLYNLYLQDSILLIRINFYFRLMLGLMVAQDLETTSGVVSHLFLLDGFYQRKILFQILLNS